MNFKLAGMSSSMIDGEGISCNIFFQGCSIGCLSCHNETLQNKNGGHVCDTSFIINHINQFKDFYNSVCFTGGEASEQKEALIDLASRITLPKVLYTGKLFGDISDDIKDVVDKVIDGPYIEESATGSFPGSSNQKIWIKKDNTWSESL